ncbi:hypothetical protein [Bradyrhizobium sp. 37]|nr:hypothetical protein [Bradyrhizobium sp. 37]MCK1303323.1 hypothetical protein [Bradyrhizobium sp. 37]
MPRYFFDHHHAAGIALDDEGIDLADVAAARRLAIKSLGQVILDAASSGDLNRVAIDVRDEKGTVLRASAAVALGEL